MVSRRKIVVYFCVIMLLIWTLFPIYQIFLFSFMHEIEMVAVPPHWIPQHPTSDNFLGVLGYPTGPFGRSFAQAEAVKRGLVNSTIIAGSVTMIALFFASMAGYSFGRYSFRFKNGLLFALLFSRLLPAIAIIIPFYYMFNQSGLLGTLPGLIIIYMAFAIPLATWVLLGTFATLPREIEKAARIDGCSRLGAIARVVVPMASAGIVAVGILVFLTCWNEFIFALILNSGSPAETLPPAIASFVSQQSAKAEPTFMAAAAALSLLPVFFLGLLLQRFITRLKIVDPVTVALE